MIAPVSRLWVIVPAAGSARRMGTLAKPKQYLPLAGRTLIEWSIAPFLRESRCEAIVVMLAADDRWWPDSPLREQARVRTAIGGADRAETVRRGLEVLPARDEDWVLVHDAARPCLCDADVRRLIDGCGEDAVGGLLAVPLVDTLKRADADGLVAQTLPREGMWRALTPQMFRYGVLRRALTQSAEGGIAVTDESQAVELLGLRPRLIAGDADNIKITVPDDLQFAERILAARGRT